MHSQEYILDKKPNCIRVLLLHNANTFLMENKMLSKIILHIYHQIIQTYCCVSKYFVIAFISCATSTYLFIHDMQLVLRIPCSV